MNDDLPERTEDPYALPGTGGVLRNRLGLDTRDALERAQATRSFQRAGQLVEEPIPGRLDLAHLQDVHHHLFKDVYDWAGEIRAWNPERAEAALGDASVDYPRWDDPDPARRLDARLDAAFAALADDDHLRGLETQPERFVERLATHMTAVWQAHAFRDGNTRATSAFFRQLIVEAGYSVAHGFPSNPRTFRDALAVAAHTGDHRPLQAGLAAELDAGPRLRALGDVGRPDPTPGETRAANEMLERRTAHELDAIRHGHYTAMRSIESNLDALRHSLESHLEGRDAAGAAGPVERARFDERWKALDTAYYTLAAEHAERTDAFELDEPRHGLLARDRAERALPDETTLARRGHDAAAFADADARWRLAEHELERHPDDPVRRRALLDAVRRVRESPTNLARLDDERRAELVAHYESLKVDRAETAVEAMLAPLATPRPERDPSVARAIVARERLAEETVRQLRPALQAQRALEDELEARRGRAADALERHDGRPGRRAGSPAEIAERRELERAVTRAETTLRHRRDDFVHDAPRREGAAREAAARALPNEAAIVRRAEERTAFDRAVERWREAERAVEARPDDRQAAALLGARVAQLTGTPGFRVRLGPERLERVEARGRALSSRGRGDGIAR